MSTHNIGFYEDLKKIIIKYAPYFFCWIVKDTCTFVVGISLKQVFLYDYENNFSARHMPGLCCYFARDTGQLV